MDDDHDGFGKRPWRCMGTDDLALDAAVGAVGVVVGAAVGTVGAATAVHGCAAVHDDADRLVFAIVQCLHAVDPTGQDIGQINDGTTHHRPTESRQCCCPMLPLKKKIHFVSIVQ